MNWFWNWVCKWRGHNYKEVSYEDQNLQGSICQRCGHVAISRAQLLKTLLPGLNALFGMTYEAGQRKRAKHRSRT